MSVSNQASVPLRSNTSMTTTSPDLTAAGKTWEQACAEAIAERDRLRAELAKTQAEREAYLKTVYHFMCKDFVCPHTTEELLACVDREPPLGDLLAELQREPRSGT